MSPAVSLASVSLASASSASVWPAWVSPVSGRILQQERDALCSDDAAERHPVIGGIPRFVTGENYGENFGLQWNRFRRTQLDSYVGFPYSRNRLRRCLGDAFASLPGSQVLEAGCGAGRFTEVLLAEGAFVTSVDLSSAVEANRDNFPIGRRHRVGQADLTRLPFAPGQFDFVICLGVLQHTPDPEASLAQLWRQVKPGGWLVVDHYTHERRWSSIRPLFRQYIKRLPRERAMAAVERLVDFYLPWHRRFRHCYPAWFALCRFSPITTFYRSYPELPEPIQREWALLDTHDSLTDWFKHKRTAAQMETALRELAGQEIAAWYAGNGVEARCRRSLSHASS